MNPDRIPDEVETALGFLTATAPKGGLSQEATDTAERIILKEILHLQAMVVRARRRWWHKFFKRG